MIVLLLGATAGAEPAIHGSAGGGGALLLTGRDGGSRLRVEGELDIAYGRFGGLLAIRAADRDHRGLLCGGLIFEAAAARPRIVLQLHADVGVDLDRTAPVAGGGLRIVVAIWRGLGVAFDTGGYLVADGIADTRLVISGSTSAVYRW